ncbi:Kinesin-like protein kif15 [Gonapodya sp. JEL0774]|nr:Kinesin-like protein kif15 [Gonapodya sp. JEL0774]
MDAVVRISYLELYNENLRDLLRPGSAAAGPGGSMAVGTMCTLREDSKKGVWVEGCIDDPVSTAQAAHSLLLQGTAERTVAATMANERSSRSHAIFTLTLRRTEKGRSELPRGKEGNDGNNGSVREVVESKIHFVDLAGSERQKFTAAQGIRLKEAGSINKSLHALSRVLDSLVARTKAAAASSASAPSSFSSVGGIGAGFTNFRDSKLTFLLKDALGGNCVTWVVGCVAAAQAAMGETLSTLRFANNAKQIKNPATRNVEIEGAPIHASLVNDYRSHFQQRTASSFQAMQSEVVRLRAELADLRTSLASCAAPSPPTPIRSPLRVSDAQSVDVPQGDTTPVFDGPDGREVVAKLLAKLEEMRELYEANSKAQKEHVGRLERALQQQRMVSLNFLQIDHRILFSSRAIFCIRAIFFEQALKLKDSNSRNATTPFCPADSPCPPPRGPPAAPEDVVALQREVDRLTHFNPDVTRFAAENLELRARLARLETPSAVDDHEFTRYLQQVLEENSRLRSPELVQRLEAELQAAIAAGSELGETMAAAEEACKDLRKENDEMRSLFESSVKQNEELRTQVSKQGTVHAEVSSELAEARAHCLNLASRVSQLEGELARRRRESAVLDIERKIIELERRCETERQRTIKAEAKCSDISVKAEMKCAEMAAEVEKLARELEEAKAQLSTLEGVDESYQILKEDNSQLAISLNETRAHAARLEAHLQAYRDSTSQHDAEVVAEANESLKQLAATVLKLESDLVAKSGDLDTVHSINRGLTEQLKVLRAVEDELKSVKGQISQLTSEKNGLALDNDQLLFENTLLTEEFEKEQIARNHAVEEITSLRTELETLRNRIVDLEMQHEHQLHMNVGFSRSESANDDALMLDSELDDHESNDEMTISNKEFAKILAEKENAGKHAENAQEELMSLRAEYRKLAEEHAKVLRRCV